MMLQSSKSVEYCEGKRESSLAIDDEAKLRVWGSLLLVLGVACRSPALGNAGRHESKRQQMWFRDPLRRPPQRDVGPRSVRWKPAPVLRKR